MQHLLLLLTTILLGPAGSVAPVAAPAAPLPRDSVLIYLVRHAEKVDDSRDPALSPAGIHRAEALARVLGEAGITRVWSTDFQRTRGTAAPLARRLALEVEAYDPRDLTTFAARLRGLPGRHLVVGHSNTTPALVAALGGDPGPPIPDSEYDRLYVVTASGTTIVLRYGSPGP